ncbi:MAG: GreA/GreB family elongation factor [Armatimonadota bacterium]|jgi:transcription elongation factor GreA
MPEPIFMTAEEIERLRNELERLKTQGRRHAREELVKARSYGDFRENAEFEEAKRAQSILEGQIKELEGVLGRAQVMAPGEESRVAVGATVIAVDLETLGEIRFNMRTAGQSDPAGISVTPDSPVGRALMGKEALDEIEVETPTSKRRYRILSVTFGA